MNLLFICSSNKDRSRTAEDVFRAEHPEHEYKSAGINRYRTTKYGTKMVDVELCKWADRIICMEDIHKIKVIEYCGAEFEDKIIVLNLGDTEKYMSESLKSILREKAEEKKIFS